MANNPLYPGYSPGKESEDDINPLYPGYYTGKPLSNKPQPKNFLKPIEFDTDTIVGEIDRIGEQVLKAPMAGPRWIKERIVDDWKSQLKVSVSSSQKLDVTELDDYSVEDFPGVSLELSLNPDDWGLNPKDDKEKRKEKFKKQLKKTINSWTKETTGIDTNNLLKPDFADFKNKQEEMMWTRAMGYGKSTSKLEDLTVTALEGQVTSPHQDYWGEKSPLNLKGVDVKVERVVKGKREIQGYADVYSGTAHAVGEFENQKGNAKQRDTCYNEIVKNATNALGLELEHYQTNSSNTVKKIINSHSEAIDFFNTQKEMLTNVYSTDKTISNTVDDIKKDLTKGTKPSMQSWALLENDIRDAINETNKNITRVEKLHQQGKISDEAFGRFKQDTAIYKNYLDKRKSVIDDVVSNKISAKTAITKISERGLGRNLTKTETFGESVAGRFQKGLENSVLGTRKGDIGKLLRDPNLKSAGINLRARALIPIIDRTRQDRIYNATMEVLDAWDGEKLLERYVWKKIKEVLPERLKAWTSGSVLGKQLEKTNYFGLKVMVDDDKDAISLAGVTDLKKIKKFKEKYGYNVSLKLDKNVFGINKIILNGGGKEFNILDPKFGIQYFNFKDSSEKALFSRLLNEKYSPGLRKDISDLIAQKRFGMSYSSLDATQQKQINEILFGKINPNTGKRYPGGLFNNAKSFRDWSNKELGAKATANSTSLLFEEVQRKNNQLSRGYKIHERKYIGKLEKLHSKLQDIQNKISQSFIGKAVRFINNWKDIIAKKAAEMAIKIFSKIMANLLGAAAVTTGFLAPLMPFIKAVAEKVIKKIFVYGEATLKAIFKLDTTELEKLVAKDVKKIVSCCLVVGILITLPFVLLGTMFFMIIGGGIGPSDMSEVSVTNFGDQASNFVGQIPGACTPKEFNPLLPWFYAQCDPDWKDIQIDSSIYNVGNAGCLLTSRAMVYKYFCYDITPKDIVGISEGFTSGGNMLHPEMDWWDEQLGLDTGIEYENLTYDSDPSSNILRWKQWFEDHPYGVMIVGINNDAGTAQHWVVLSGYDEDANDFVLQDPWSGPDKLFLETYSDFNIIGSRGYYRDTPPTGC